MKMDTEKALENLRQLVQRMSPVGEAEWEALGSIWQPFEAGRKEVLTTAGEVERWLYFVVQGVQRVYYADDAGREATIVFMYPPSFGGVLDAFLLQKPAAYYFETLTPSVFLRTSYTQLNELMLQYPGIERMIRTGLTQTFSGILQRLAELQCFTAEEKFRSLLKRSPHVLQLIPHKYLANYLGMDATNFSKLLGTVRIG